jgi:hypothetical protein
MDRIHHPANRPVVRVRSTRVPAYFLGRRREVWVAATAWTPVVLAPAA